MILHFEVGMVLLDHLITYHDTGNRVFTLLPPLELYGLSEQWVIVYFANFHLQVNGHFRVNR